MESNDSPEIPDRGETSDIPGLPSGANTVKLCRGFGKNEDEWIGKVEISKEEIPGSRRSMHSYILTYSRLKRDDKGLKFQTGYSKHQFTWIRYSSSIKKTSNECEIYVTFVI